MGTVRLCSLTKVYDSGDVAVDAVDLTIRDGEFFVLLGPSGCGKTSLLRMIAGLEPITAGDVTVDGRSIRDVEPRTRELGMLFQQSAVYPHLSVRDNIGFPLRLAGCKRAVIDRRVAELAHAVGVHDVLDSKPAQLSGGMRQRVAMARAIARKPSMLLMDEPMSNLDAKMRTELRSLLSALHQRTRATTIYVTHDQVEAMALGDRAAVMRGGHVVQCAPPAELYAHPVDLFVASFLGAPPINVVRARLQATSAGLVLDLGSDRIAIGTADDWPEIGPWLGQDVAVGFRPDGLEVATDPVTAQLRVEIVRVEDRGADRVAWATLEAHAVSDDDGVVVDAEPLTTIGLLVEDVEVDLWRPVDVAVDVARLHLFDLATGRRIRRESERRDALDDVSRRAPAFRRS